MAQVFWTPHCAFDFDHKFCDAHIPYIKIEAKQRGGSVPAIATLNDRDKAVV